MTGLLGANCYHTYYPFIEGISKRAYTDEQLKEWASQDKKKYNGKEYTGYEAKQRMRQLETNMCAQREEIVLLEEGDMFYIHVLDETLAYQVDQILDMVDKDDMETLEEALQVVPGEDHVTLFTCTPYGVNSHRLLVRGTRVPYTGEEEVESTPVDTMLRAVQNYYMLYLILGLSVTLLVILIMKFLFGRSRKKGGGDRTDQSS